MRELSQLPKRDIDEEAVTLDEREAAALIGICQKTLSNYRKNPAEKVPFFRVGRRVKYLRAELIAWMRERAGLGAVSSKGER